MVSPLKIAWKTSNQHSQAMSMSRVHGSMCSGAWGSPSYANSAIFASFLRVIPVCIALELEW